MHRSSSRRRVAVAVLLGTALALPASAPRAQSQKSRPQPPQLPAAPTVLASSPTAREPRPSPALTPDQVVSIQIDALQHNDAPTRDHGIQVAYAFTAPGSRGAGEPIEQFAAVVRGWTYNPMLNYRSVERGPMLVKGDEARQRVTVVTESGDRVTYIFILSRQHGGEFDGCWMTDGVSRLNDTGPRPDGLRSA